MSVDHILNHRQHLMAMSSASSGSSDAGSLGGFQRRVSIPRSTIDIHLHNHYSSKVYSSGSPISGDVTFTTKRDVPFDYIQVLLVGQTRTLVDGVNSPHEVTHTFLKMPMPVPESAYPVPRVLESGRPFTLPFNFVVPSYLTINACSHHISSEQIRDQHVLLPPTVGGWDRDDLAPQMTQIQYSVRARVFREPDLGRNPVKVMEASQNIRVLPARHEEAPLSVTKHDRLYCMAKAKSLRKNIISAKLGRLTATATQPPAAFLRPDGRKVGTTTAPIHLKFEPASADVLPPKVTSVSGKVVAHSFFSAGTIPSFPNLGDWSRQVAVEKRGAYSTSVSLPHVAAADAVRWTQQISPMARRDSGYCSSEDELDSDSETPGQGQGQSARTQRRESSRAAGSSQRNGKSRTRSGSPILHTAVINVPVTLPVDRKMFIPTFHSCIASRVYVLQLSVTVSVGTATSTLALSVPLQVAVEPSSRLLGQDAEGLPTFEAAMEEAEADEHLQPRVLLVPEEQYRQTSSLPGYGDLVAAR